MVKAEVQGVPNYGGIDFDSAAPRQPLRKAMALLAVAAVLVVAVATVTLSTAEAQQGSVMQSLATKKQPVKYGDTITLMNVYNNYMVVSANGRTFTGGYYGQNDRIRVVSPRGKSGQVQYGDTVSLVGQNNRYFTARYSAKVTCRAAVITTASQFTTVGGTGPIMVGDKIAFKSMYGFMTGTPSGVRGDTPTVTSAEQYTVGIPGQEVGLAARPGLQYGQTVTLQNRFNEFLQSDPNGWVYLRGSNGDWNHFDVLSPLHRQGLVEYGDDIILRSHNTKMLSAAPGGNLEAIKLIPDQDCVWTLVGGQGVIHNMDEVALRGPQGFINARMGAARGSVDTSGHYNPSQNFVLQFNLHQKM
jgi:hypothetical protein